MKKRIFTVNGGQGYSEHRRARSPERAALAKSKHVRRTGTFRVTEIATGCGWAVAVYQNFWGRYGAAVVKGT